MGGSGICGFAELVAGDFQGLNEFLGEIPSWLAAGKRRRKCGDSCNLNLPRYSPFFTLHFGSE
jgi:hypothetical protein